MSNLLSSLSKTIHASLALAILLFLGVFYLNDGFSFDTLFWCWLARLTHVVVSIIFIGFNTNNHTSIYLFSKMEKKSHWSFWPIKVGLQTYAYGIGAQIKNKVYFILNSHYSINHRYCQSTDRLKNGRGKKRGS